MKAQFTRSASPAGAIRCSRRWPSPRTAAAPPRVPRARDQRSTSASLRHRGVNRRRRGVHTGVRGIEVTGPEAPDVEPNHLGVLLRNPHHDGLGEASGTLLMAGERPKRSAHDESERADDARGWAAEIVQQTLQWAGPRHGGTPPRRRGARDVREEHGGKSERHADEEVSVEVAM